MVAKDEIISTRKNRILEKFTFLEIHSAKSKIKNQYCKLN